MDVLFNDSELTAHQISLADRLERVIESRARYSRQVCPSIGNGPSIECAIRTRTPNLSVAIVVYQDSVQIAANGADVIIELLDPDHYAEWADAAGAAVAPLLRTTLRLRLRRTRWLRRPAGAIELSYENEDVWSGDALSCYGVGTMLAFEDWYEHASG